MELPPFVYALAFWEALSWVGAGVLALLVYFRKVDSRWALSAGAILSVILAVLKFLGVVPELMLRGLI